MERIEKSIKLFTNDRKKAYNWAKKMEKKGYGISAISFSEKRLSDPYGINTEIEATITEKFNPKK